MQTGFPSFVNRWTKITLQLPCWLVFLFLLLLIPNKTAEIGEGNQHTKHKGEGEKKQISSDQIHKRREI